MLPSSPVLPSSECKESLFHTACAITYESFPIGCWTREGWKHVLWAMAEDEMFGPLGSWRQRWCVVPGWTPPPPPAPRSPPTWGPHRLAWWATGGGD